MKIEDAGLVLEIDRFNEEGDYIQIGDRPTGPIFRGGLGTLKMLEEAEKRRKEMLNERQMEGIVKLDR